MYIYIYIHAHTLTHIYLPGPPIQLRSILSGSVKGKRQITRVLMIVGFHSPDTRLNRLSTWRYCPQSRRRFTKKMKSPVILACKDDPTAHGTRREKERQAGKEMGLGLGEALRKAEDREEWRKVVARSSLMPQRSFSLRDE